MAKNIEIEFKILINEKTYNQIIQDYSPYLIDAYIQTNIYFTHPIFLQNKYMLRIREKKNVYEMTLKKPYHNHSVETNITLSSQEKDDFINFRKTNDEMNALFLELGINPQDLDELATLTTYRCDFNLDGDILSLDKNSYNQFLDYELELEVQNEQLGYNKFIKIINDYQLHYTKNAQSKFKRVLDSLGGTHD